MSKSITFTKDNGVTLAKVADLFLFKDNPRDIEAHDFNRLKEQIKLGEHSPLLVTTEGEVLGGNTRLRAYKELGKENAKVVVVEIVKSGSGKVHILVDGLKSERVFDSVAQAKIELALSHNDSIGTNNELKLAELLTLHKIETTVYSVATKIQPVQDILDKVSPTPIDESASNSEVDTDSMMNGKTIICPKCHFEWEKGKENEDEGY